MKIETCLRRDMASVLRGNLSKEILASREVASNDWVIAMDLVLYVCYRLRMDKVI